MMMILKMVLFVVDKRRRDEDGEREGERERKKDGKRKRKEAGWLEPIFPFFFEVNA